MRSDYIPELSAGLVEALTARNQAADAELRRAIAAERAETARVVGVCRALSGEVHKLLLAAGFHQHKRQWRRRRMPKGSSETAPVPSGAPRDEAELLTEAMYSKKPSEEAKALVAKLLKAPGLWRHHGDIMGEALKETVGASSHSYFDAESLKHGLEEMKAGLGFEGSSLPERLLIDQVLLCWLRLSLLERGQAKALASSQSYAHLSHLEKATTQAQRRYTNAISSLGRRHPEPALARPTPHLRHAAGGGRVLGGDDLGADGAHRPEDDPPLHARHRPGEARGRRGR